MLHNINWAGFALVVIWLSAIHYITIVAIFYRKEVIRFAREKMFRKESWTLQRAKAPEQPDLYAVSRVLIDKLQLRLSKLNSATRDNWLMAVRFTLQEFPQLKGTAFQVAVNNWIMEDSNKRSLPLSDDELDMLWNG